MTELGMREEGKKKAKHAEEGDFGVKNVKKGKKDRSCGECLLIPKIKRFR
jgi:hypothetical protein